jgi:hypothetical protein
MIKIKKRDILAFVKAVENVPIKLDEFFYKLICTGTDNYYGQTINTWIIGS